MNCMTIRSLKDESTTERFKFIAYCEHCSKLVKTYVSISEACYRPKLFTDLAARRAKELLWLQAHEQARENAAREALQELNCCEVCGAMVCNACTLFSDALEGGVCCTSCANKPKKKTKEKEN